MRRSAPLAILLALLAAAPLFILWWLTGFLVVFDGRWAPNDILWLAPLGAAIVAIFSAVGSFARGAVVIASLFLATLLFLDSGSYHMLPNVSSCLTQLGVWLLPLGEGVAVSVRLFEGLLSLALVAFAVVVARRRARTLEGVSVLPTGPTDRQNGAQG